jgi:hypothetical protein
MAELWLLTLYEAFELQPCCTQTECKAAWRVMAMRYHPDKDGESVSFAWMKFCSTILLSPSRRLAYDREGFAAFREHTAFAPTAPTPTVLSDVTVNAPRMNEEFIRLVMGLEGSLDWSWGAMSLREALGKCLEAEGRVTDTYRECGL